MRLCKDCPAFLKNEEGGGGWCRAEFPKIISHTPGPQGTTTGGWPPTQDGAWCIAGQTLWLPKVL
jgi:hypothetical protein